MNDIIVICARDEHIDNLKRCVRCLKGVFKDSVDIGLAVYGIVGFPQSVKVKRFAELKGFQFYDSPRAKTFKYNGYPDCILEIHRPKYPQVPVIMEISNHFNQSYRNVYVIQSDVFVRKDFRPVYEKFMKDNWAFVAPIASTTKPLMKDYSQVISDMIRKKTMSKDLVHSPYRLRFTIITFNKLFTSEVFVRYKSIYNIQDAFLSDSIPVADICLIDLFQKKLLGFEGHLIPTMIGLDYGSTLGPEGIEIYYRHTGT